MSSPRDSCDNHGIFYTYPQDGKNPDGTAKFEKTQAVLDKFMRDSNGKCVPDPNSGGSDGVGLYTRLNADGTIDASSRFTNPNNFLVLPAKHGGDAAQAYAAKLNSKWLIPRLWSMIGAFWRHGSQDYQRGREHGVPDQETNPVVTDSASYNLGEVTELTNVPNVFAEIGRAIVNISRKHPALDRHYYGMEKGDGLNFDAGVLAAKALTLHQAALAIGRAHSISIAPLPNKGSGRQSSARLNSYASSGEAGLSAGQLRRIATAAVFGASGAETLGADALRRLAHLSSGMRFSVGRSISEITSLAKTAYRATVVPGALNLLRPPMAGTIRASRQNLASSGTKLSVGFTRSFAPVGAAAQRAMANAGQFAGGGRFTGSASDRQGEVPESHSYQPPPRESLAQELSDLLGLDLPPNGATGFDPRISAAWAGRKLPS